MMRNYSWEILYIGLLLPSLFSATFLIEGIYKIYKREEGGFMFFLALVFMLELALFYIFFIPK